MFTDKYLCDGKYSTDGKIKYCDPLEFIMHEIFKWCGCGLSENALNYVYMHMLPFLRLQDYEYNTVYSIKRTKSAYENIYNSFKNDIEGADYFFWYWLDNLGLTEHGGSIPGWLTEKGYELIQELKERKENGEF